MTGRCAAQDGADGAGHDAVPVQVAAAVEIAAAGDGDRQAVGVGVGLRDQVGAGLADVVGMPALQRRALVVGQLLLVAVGLVRRGDDDLLDRRAAAAGLQQRPGALDVGLEGGDRVAVGDADDGLRRQVDDGVDLVLAERAFEQSLVATSPRTTLTRSSSAERTSSDCGTQSRTRQTTSAPAASSALTSQLPTRPVAPVTKVGRSSQKLSARPE